MNKDYPPEAWQRLGRAVQQRRKELDHTQPSLAIAAGISVSVLSKIERAASTRYEDRGLMRLEDVLRWPRGRVEAILNDQEGAQAQTSPDAETTDTGSRFADYPDFVGDDPFLRHIWRYAGAPELERVVAIIAVQAHRQAAKLVQ